jgi:hypothetical protein
MPPHSLRFISPTVCRKQAVQLTGTTDHEFQFESAASTRCRQIMLSLPSIAIVFTRYANLYA